MRILSVIWKSMLEQIRSYWLLLLVITMVPFFVFVYYTISKTYHPKYKVVVCNEDKGVVMTGLELVNMGQKIIRFLEENDLSSEETGLFVETAPSREEAEEKIRNRTADMIIILPPDFSRRIAAMRDSGIQRGPGLEFAGDLTNINYLISAIWVEDYLMRFVYDATGIPRPFEFKETGIGVSGNRSDFELYVPGLIILSTIMLMFTASIALVTEAEKRTMIRLKMSRLTTLEFLCGVIVVQIIISIVAVTLTLVTAVALGFRVEGSPALFFLIILLCTVSIIAFSVIVAGITDTVNAILIVGNFPMFIFMFFTGAAFPMRTAELFSIGGYSITVNGILSPTHAVSALNKVLIMNEGIGKILPEILCMLVLTVIYFIAGAWLFNHRHMRAQ